MSGRRSRLAPIAAIAGLTVAGSAAGCGSSSHSATSTSAPAITKTAFVTKANAICTHDNAQIAAAVAKLGKTPTKAKITAFAKGTSSHLLRPNSLGSGHYAHRPETTRRSRTCST